MISKNNFWFQLFQRLFSTNPKFFKVIQIASIVCAAVTGLPELFSWLGVTLPEAWQAISSVAIAKASLLLAVFSQLPNDDKKSNGEEDLSDPTTPKHTKP